jgi:plasmid replication initiation protein
LVEKQKKGGGGDMSGGLIVKKNSCLQPMTVLNLEERRLFTFCLTFYDSRPGAENPETFSISLDQFKAAYPEYSSKKPGYIFQVVKAAVNGIQQKPYQPDLDKKRVIWWFAALEVDAHMITFSLTKQVMPFFLDIRDRFIRYKMIEVDRLVKPNAWNLYEYLKEKYMNGLCPSWTVEVEDLKERLGVMGKYQRFGDFDTRCLKQPLQDINKNTDLVAEYQKQKRGVKVHAIIFNVKTKAADPAVIDVEDLSKVFQQTQLRHGISPAAAARNTEQAEKIGKLSDAISKIDSAHTSWKKTGKGPFSAYLASTLTSFLFERSLFQDNRDQEKAAFIADLKKLDTGSLRTLAGAGNIHAEKILQEREKVIAH